MPARPALTPQIRFLYIGSRVCSTLLSDLASQRRPCASLSLHLHQVVKRTFTFELLNMLGTHAKGPDFFSRSLREFGSELRVLRTDKSRRPNAIDAPSHHGFNPYHHCKSEYSTISDELHSIS